MCRLLVLNFLWSLQSGESPRRRGEWERECVYMCLFVCLFECVCVFVCVCIYVCEREMCVREKSVAKYLPRKRKEKPKETIFLKQNLNAIVNLVFFVRYMTHACSLSYFWQTDCLIFKISLRDAKIKSKFFRSLHLTKFAFDLWGF